jgi:hypothetical protein
MPRNPACSLLCAGALASLAVSVSNAQAADLRDSVRAWRKSHEQAIVSEFVRFLSMPNVATNIEDVDRNASLDFRLAPGETPAPLWDGIEVYAGAGRGPELVGPGGV